MAQDSQSLLIKIEATTAQLRREMQNADAVVGKSTRAMDSSLSRADKAFARLNSSASHSLGGLGGGFNMLAASIKAATGALAAFSVASILKSALSEQEQLQRNMLRTEALITATGGAAGFSAKQLHEQARALNSVTLGSTEGIMKAQQVMLSFDKVTGDTFTRGIELAMDMSSTIEGGLSSSVTMLGKALQDPIKGLTAMSKAGVSFSAEQSDLIKKMVSVGDAAGAQEVILTGLARNYGGVATNEARGLAGAQDTLGQSIQEAQIALADQLQLADRAADGYAAMSKVVVALGDNVDVLVRGGEILAVMIGGRLVAAAGMSAASFVTAQIAAMRYQATLARMAGVSAATAVGLTAMSVAARTASAAMALLGGPVGAAIIAASAIFYFGTRASKAERETEALDKRIAKLGGSFDKLNADQAAASIVDYTAKLNAAQAVAEAAAAKVFTLNDNIARFPGSPKQEQWRAELVQAKGAAADANVVVGEQNVIITQLTEIINRNTDARVENNGATVEGIAAGEKYLAQLQTQINRMQDKTAVQAANRVLTENQIDAESELGKKILAAAAAQDKQRAADASATAGTKTGTKAVDERIKAIDAMIAKYDPAAKAQEDYAKGVALADSALSDGTYTLKQYQNVIQGLYTELHKPTWDKFNAEADESTAALKRVDDSVQAVLDRLDPITAATRDYADEQKLLTDAMERYPQNAEAYRQALALLGDEYRANQGSVSIWAQMTEGAVDRVDSAFADMWKGVFDGSKSTLDGMKSAVKQWLAEVAHMLLTKPLMVSFGNMLMGTNNAGGFTQTMASLFSGSGGAAAGGGGSAGGMGSMVGMAQNLYSAYSAITGVGSSIVSGYASGGIGGAVSGGAGYYGTMLGNLGTTLSGGFSSIVGAITGQTAAQAASAAAAQAAGAAAGNSLAVNAGAYAASSGGVAASVTSAMSSAAAMWPLAVVMGMYQSGKLYDAGVRADAGRVQDTSNGTVLADSMLAPGVFQAKFFEKLDGLLGGSKAAAIITGSTFSQAVWEWLGGGLFGGKWATRSGGLSVGVEGGEFAGQTYEDQKKKGGWFRSDKKRTVFSGLDAETSNYFEGLYANAGLGISTLFQRVGVELEAGALDGLNIAASRITTMGQSQEQITAAVSKWMGGVSDTMAAHLSDYAATGFGAGLTVQGLVDLVDGLEGSNQALTYLNVGLFDVSAFGARAAKDLLSLAGDIAGLVDPTVAERLAALSSLTAGYYDRFFSDAEKQADTLDAVNKQFESMGLTLPDTRSAYRDMVEDIDLTTVAGKEMFTTLMRLSGAADAAFSITEARAVAAQQAAEAVYAELAEAVKGYYLEFVGEAERSANTLGAVTATFAALNVTLPATREGFRAMVDGLDLTTEAGQRMFETLMGLAGPAAEAFAILEAQAVATQAAIEAQAAAAQAYQAALATQYDTAVAFAQASFTALKTSIDAEKARLQAEAAAIEAQYSTVIAFAETSFAALKTSIDAEKARIEAETAAVTAKYDTAISLAQAGFSALQSAIGTEKARMEADAGAIAAQYDTALSFAQASFGALQTSIDAEKARLEAESSAITAKYDTAIALAETGFSALQRSIDAEKTAIDEVYSRTSDGINDLRSLSGSLGSALKSMRLESEQFDEGRRAAAKLQLSAALATGRAGGSLKETDLSDALGELGQSSSQFYGSFEDYARDYWRTAHDINELNGLTVDQLSAEEQTLVALDAQLESLNDILAGGRQQLDTLLGIDSGVMATGLALAQFNASLQSAQAATVTRDEALAALDQENQAVYFDRLLADGQAQLDKLLGIDSGVMSVRAALEQFSGAMASAQAATVARDEALAALDQANQIAYLDKVLAGGQQQLDTLLGIDGSVLSVSAALEQFNGLIVSAQEATAAREAALSTSQAQLASLDSILADGQQQLNTLLGIDGSVLGVRDALAQFNDSLVSAQAATAARAEAIAALDQASRVAYFDQVQNDAQRQIDILTGINSSVLSVGLALANFQRSMAAADAAKAAKAAQGDAQANEKAVKDAYLSVLGRTGEADGISYWLKKLDSGELTQANLNVQLAQGALDFDSSNYAGVVSDELIASSKAAAGKYLGVPGYASGGSFGGGLRLVGENGPELEVTGPSRIYSAGQTAAMLSGGESAGEIRALRAEVAGLNNSLRAIAKHTMTTSKHTQYLERFDVDGLPATRTA